jgi:hypothetical protein
VSKQEVNQFLEIAFQQELFENARSYLVGADSFNDSIGRRFSKSISNDRIFRAIRYLRAHHISTERARGCLPDFSAEELEQMTGPYDSAFERVLCSEFISAVKSGDTYRLKDIVKLVEIHETAMITKERKHDTRDTIPWHYYVGMAARQCFRKGRIPTKKEVREIAICDRAIAELEWISDGSQRKQRIAKIRKLPLEKSGLRSGNLQPICAYQWTPVDNHFAEISARKGWDYTSSEHSGRDESRDNRDAINVSDLGFGSW